MTEAAGLLPVRLGDAADAPVAALGEARLEDGRRRGVRHGAGPARAIQAGVGPVPVRRPKSLPRTGSGVRERDAGAAAPARCASVILPRGARRTRSLDARLPVLHRRGVSTGDVGEALGALPGRDAPDPGSGPGPARSPSAIGRPKKTRAGTGTSPGRPGTSRRAAASASGRMGCPSGPGWVRPMGRTRPRAEKALAGFRSLPRTGSGVGVRESARDAGARGASS